MYSSKQNINILTSLLVSHGVKQVVVCPGSRNAPLVHNFNECPDLICHAVTDERSAGFVALGLRAGTNAPVAVCVTSGSALLNLMPAVSEATYRHMGLIVISADRPASWIGQLDGQTMPQPGALGGFVARTVNLPEPSNDVERWQCNRDVNEALMENGRVHHPSVHINVQISEPLFEFACPSLPLERVISRVTVRQDEVIRRILSSDRLMFVFGQLPEETIDAASAAALSEYAVLLAEPLSGNFSSLCITDQAVHLINGGTIASDSYVPDCVVYMGGNTVSKGLRKFLRESCAESLHVTVSEDGSLHDISCHTSIVVEAEPADFIGALCAARKGMTVNSGQRSAYLDDWGKLKQSIECRHNAFVPAYSQMLAVKLFEESVGENDTVHYANSMSVRLCELYARNYRFCNRGLNGIEGSLSTAVGASIAKTVSGKTGRTFCVTGDLSFIYDENALWQGELGGNFRILLLNNHQGGIFKSLQGLSASAVADTIVAGRHSVSAEGVCSQFGVIYHSAVNAGELSAGLSELVHSSSERPMLLEVFTDAEEDMRVFRDYYENISSL